MDLGDPDFEPKGYVTKCNDKFIYITGSCKEFVNQFYDDPLKIQKVNEISPDLNPGTYVWIYLETKPKNVFLKVLGIPDRKIIVKEVISKSEVATEHLPTVYIYHRQNGNNVSKIFFAGELRVTEDTKENSKKRPYPVKTFKFNVLSGSYSATLCQKENYCKNITDEIKKLLQNHYRIDNIEMKDKHSDDDKTYITNDKITCSNLNTYIQAGLKVYSFPDEQVYKQMLKIRDDINLCKDYIDFHKKNMDTFNKNISKDFNEKQIEEQNELYRKDIENEKEKIEKHTNELKKYDKYLLKKQFPRFSTPSLFGKRRSRRKSKRRSKRRSRKVLGNNLRKKI